MLSPLQTSTHPGVDDSRLSGHTFRKGAATMAAKTDRAKWLPNKDTGSLEVISMLTLYKNHPMDECHNSVGGTSVMSLTYTRTNSRITVAHQHNVMWFFLSAMNQCISMKGYLLDNCA